MPFSSRPRYEPELRSAAAANLLRAEFHREGGPRGAGGHAPIDTEAETAIRERLLAAFPEYGFIAEEEPRHDRPARDRDQHVWVVDASHARSGSGRLTP
jgi:fructose-1,6-bisphosphatase/inositol monophosphatase family enzyme